MTLGVGNGAFGLPHRELANNAFVVRAIAARIACLITDAAKVRPIVMALTLASAVINTADATSERVERQEQQKQ